jgi:Leucine-rich repeat (LRR) protein
MRLTALLLLASLSPTASSCGCCATRDGALSSCSDCPASITALRLGYCGLTAVLPGAFASNCSLVSSLDLSNNALRELPAGAFEGLPALAFLDLSFNFINVVAPGALSDDFLPALATLDLGFNELPAAALPALQLSKLTSLGVYWNPLANFSDASFLGVPALQALDANNCGLSFVSPAAFAPLAALATLNVGHNALAELPPRGWRGPSKLTTLALQANALAALPPRFLDAFPLLEALPLYANQLAALEAGTFAALPNLAGLYLNDNNISVLHEGCFAGLSGGRFQYLALANNLLAPAACNANFAAVAAIPSACFSA